MIQSYNGLILGSYSILETSRQGSLVPLYQTLQSTVSKKDPESSSSGIFIWAQTSEPPQLPAQKVQQTNTSVAESLPSLAEQANSSESQIPIRKHQQNQSSTPTVNRSKLENKMSAKADQNQNQMLETNHMGKVLRCALASRIIVLSLIVMWRSLVSPYDTSASLNPDCLSLNSNTAYFGSSEHVLMPWIASSIEKSIVWDSVYFIRIAECGYEYEQSYAFLPLLPILISMLTNTVLRPLVPLIGYRAVLGLSGYAINNVAFLLAAVYFYRSPSS
ncbi:hypothetical protein Ancab_014126 [Ancistrocladus abbreviatus]